MTKRTTIEVQCNLKFTVSTLIDEVDNKPSLEIIREEIRDHLPEYIEDYQISGLQITEVT